MGDIFIAKVTLNIYESKGLVVLSNSGKRVSVTFYKNSKCIFKRDFLSLGKAKREFRRVIRKFLDGTLGVGFDAKRIPPRPYQASSTLHRKDKIVEVNDESA